MKNAPIKVMSILLLGAALSACSMLQNLTGSDKVKFSSYKNEVNNEEFAAGMAESLAKNAALTGEEDANDFALSLSLTASLDQKITNSEAAVKDRSSTSASAKASAKLAYDLDNAAVELTGKLTIDGKMVTPTYGTQKVSSETALDLQAQQEKEGEMVTINKKEKTYSVEESETSLRDTMTQLRSLLGSGAYYIAQSVSAMEVKEDETMKLYKDGDVYTIIYTMKEAGEVRESYYNGQDYVSYKVGDAESDLSVKLQFDLSEKMKIRAELKVEMTTNYIKDCDKGSSIIDISSVSAGSERRAGDKDVQKVQLGLSADYTNKAQSVKKVDTSSYTKVEEIINL